MKVHILTAVYYPEIHPRAFRAYELSKEFSRKGHEVTVSVLTTVIGFDYGKLSQKENIEIQLLKLYKTKTDNHSRQIFSSQNRFLIWLHNIFRFCVDYFLAGNLFSYGRKISQKLTVDSNCDMLITLSTPFMDLYGAALYRKKFFNRHSVFVADSGDPFYYSQQTKRAFYFKWIEKWVYKQFDYLVIPTETAVSAYSKLINKNKIKIIPQGFDFNSTTLAQTINNARTIFAYAGVFYKDIRNPKFLLDYLTAKQSDFLFKIYLRHKDPEITMLLDSYKDKLKDKLEIKYGIKREQLIYELSACDFLINIGNTTQTQLPSKLIDYGITKRPFYSCIKETFDKEVFEQFLKKDYSSFVPLDISKYSIDVVAKQFISLVN